MPIEARIAEYEVFRNARNALAFFMARHSALDGNAPHGPFWFTVEGNTVRAGTGACHAVFEDVPDHILRVARHRGVLMVVEFEERQAVRCTPCYLSDAF